MPEFIDPVFTKTSPKRSFSLNRKRAFWLVFAKTGSIISGTGCYCQARYMTKRQNLFLVTVQDLCQMIQQDKIMPKKTNYVGNYTRLLLMEARNYSVQVGAQD